MNDNDYIRRLREHDPWYQAVWARDKNALLTVIRERSMTFSVHGAWEDDDGRVAKELLQELEAENRIRWVTIDGRTQRLETVP